MDDIHGTMLTARGGTPVLVRDVATVTVGNQPRLGIAGQNDSDDTVQGIVLMRRGEQDHADHRGSVLPKSTGSKPAASCRRASRSGASTTART